MRAYRTLIPVSTALGVALTLSACNEALVPDFNNLAGFPHNASALQNEFTGAFMRTRDEIGFFVQLTDAFAREDAYYTPSEERFVTQLTGEQPLDDDNFGAGMWDVEFNAVKVADTVISIIPQLTLKSGGALPAANQKALIGVLETTKALDYMYVALSHDTNGVAVNAVGQSTSSPAPILCAKDTWKEIVAMLDSAKADLDAAGAGTGLGFPDGSFTLTLPPGYAALGSTAGSYEALTLALRGRARIEYAYAIARQAGGSSAPSSTSPGAPDQAQLDSAIADIQASSLYSATLNPAAASAQADLGVFHSFSSASGDVANPTFGNASSMFVLLGALNQIHITKDQRFLTKFVLEPAKPTSPGNSAASQYAMNLANINISTPIPITRNVELNFLLARAYLGTGQTVLAAQTIDNIRTTVGGLPTGLLPDTLIYPDPTDTTGVKQDTTINTVNPASYTSVRDFLLREQIPSLMTDGLGDEIVAIRDYGLIMQLLTTWGSSDQHTSMENIPLTEREARGGNYAAVCP